MVFVVVVLLSVCDSSFVVGDVVVVVFVEVVLLSVCSSRFVECLW